MLVLKNISKIYTRKQSQEDVVALDDVSLDLPDKGFVAILGASGSGKTTLLNIIGGLDKATSGNMIVDGLSTNEFSAKEWDSYRNQKIGFVLQNCYLLSHLNVRDNVAVKLQISHSNYKDIDILVDEALKRVDLIDKKFDKPKSLSGGQKQRVAIARALVGSPTVILADEPTGALDSKTGTSIMKLLKEASKDHLVVMVTHNNEYASKYADRVIELKDGKIINDSSSIKNEVVENPKKLEKVSIPPATTLKWGFKNLIVKKFSTLSVIIAAALGLTGVALILSVSTGVQHAFDKVEAESFSKYPVSFSSYTQTDPQWDSTKYVPYTDEQIVIADYSSYRKEEHYNYMSSDFLNYMNNMPSEYYIGKFERSTTYFHLYTMRKSSPATYAEVPASYYYFYKGVDNVDFIDMQYDCLQGDFPKEANDLALIVDDRNRVNVGILASLGFDVNTSVVEEKTFSFDDVLNKTFKYVDNNHYYVKNSNDVYVRSSVSPEALYSSSTFEMRITGILRQKKDYDRVALRNGIIYTPAFEEYTLANANASDIVVEQKSFGLTRNVTDTNKNPFTDDATHSATYYYEVKLNQLGAYSVITELDYYTNNYDNRVKIKDYFEKYVFDLEVEPTYVSPYDYLENASAQFDGALKLMTSVLYVFAIISVLVSAILNAILTFISVRQRTNEIGLLRSLGARKKDVAVMVETESIICGLLGGAVSVLLALLIIGPVNKLITNAIYRYKFYLLSSVSFELEGYQWWVAPVCIGLGIATALVSALIPAILASKKDPAKAINE